MPSEVEDTNIGEDDGAPGVYMTADISPEGLMAIYVGGAASGKADMLTQEGHIYVAEQAVIKRLAVINRQFSWATVLLKH